MKTPIEIRPSPCPSQAPRRFACKISPPYVAPLSSSSRAHVMTQVAYLVDENNTESSVLRRWEALALFVLSGYILILQAAFRMFKIKCHPEHAPVVERWRSLWLHWSLWQVGWRSWCRPGFVVVALFGDHGVVILGLGHRRSVCCVHIRSWPVASKQRCCFQFHTVYLRLFYSDNEVGYVDRKKFPAAVAMQLGWQSESGEDKSRTLGWEIGGDVLHSGYNFGNYSCSLFCVSLSQPYRSLANCQYRPTKLYSERTCNFSSSLYDACRSQTTWWNTYSVGVGYFT